MNTNTTTGRGHSNSIRALNSDEVKPPAESLASISREVNRKFDAWLERRGFVKPSRPFQSNSLFKKPRK